MPFSHPHGPSCKECLTLLVDYLDGRLEPEQERALDAHFSACPPCIDFVDQYRGASTLVRRAEGDAIPADVEGRLACFVDRLIGAKGGQGEPS